MALAAWNGEASRRINERIVLEGELVLLTPASFGNGAPGEVVDLPLLVDPLDGTSPLLTGPSLAGALRAYLRARDRGDAHPLPDLIDGEALIDRERAGAAVRLFGGFRTDPDGEQSAVIVDDAIGRGPGIELREGVRLDPTTRTASADQLFDRQLWPAGTTFPLRFELTLCDREGVDPAELKRGLATALAGLHDGSIRLGARKSRGYGRVLARNWLTRSYRVARRPDNPTWPADLLAWIVEGDRPLAGTPRPTAAAALGVPDLLPDARAFFRLEACFDLPGSLLIRSGAGRDDFGPDVVHLHARQVDGDRKPILSGTSAAGALRARAAKIARTLAEHYRANGAVDDTAGNRAQALIDDLFGPEIRDGIQPRASRLTVEERAIEPAVADLVQNRVGIDRFTGGARETALFNEQPVFGTSATTVAVDLGLSAPRDHEIGLLLLLLKDLWTEDLPLGGESSVGRGRLRGRSATLTLQRGGTTTVWTINAAGPSLTITGDREWLERRVSTDLQDYFAAPAGPEVGS